MEHGMKIHRLKKESAGATPDVHQQTVVVAAAAAGNSLEDRGRGQPHSVMST